MAEFIVHDLVQYGSLKKWIVFTNEDVIKNYEAAFGEKGASNLIKAILIHETDFYEIKRYYQFVGLIAYKHSQRMLTMSLFESEEMNNFLDGFLDLKIQDWKVEDLNTIGEITQQIIDYPNEEVATIKLNKLL